MKPHPPSRDASPDAPQQREVEPRRPPGQTDASHPSAVQGGPLLQSWAPEQVRILMVEDDPVEIRLNRQQLKRMGYPPPLLAGDGREALEILEQNDVDLALVDIDLPGEWDGIETSRRLLRQRNIPLVFLTAFTSQELLLRATEVKPRGYLVKPVNHLTLHSTIQMGLANHALERELADTAVNLAHLAGQSPDAIVVVDTTGKVLFHNRAATELFFHREDLDGALFGFPLPTGDEAVEICVKCRQDEWRVAEMRAAATTWAGCKATLVSIRDITSRLRDQEEKDLLREQLIQAQKMEGLGTLASGIAHDFNNYLAGIFGYTELALDKMSTGQDNSYELERVLAASNRARGLVRQVLTFSRRIKGQRKKLDLNQQVSECVALLRNTLPRMLHIDLHLSSDLEPVEADPGQLEQVVLNLATNARDAMPDGGLLSLSTFNRSVDNGVCQACGASFFGNFVMLQVSDTGHGMDRETIKRAFDPFFTTKGVGKGTGLGLSSVFGIVAAHEGHVTVTSSPGRGTTFCIYLPVRTSQDRPGEESRFQPAGTELPTGRERILVVDDENSVLEVVQRMLQTLGYEVETAASGEEGLKKLALAAGGVSLVLLDLNMPGMGGFQAMQTIGELYPDLPVLVISGHSSPQDITHVNNGGAAGFLAKPFLQTELAQMVRAALDA